MPRILAIDWDRREARALLLVSGATGVSVAGAWAVPLATADGASLGGREIGEKLAAAISDKASGKIISLVGVGRDHVQMQLLALPPAPPDELPDMVRFQSEREFTTLGSDAALDFIPIAGDQEKPHQVLAVALSHTGSAEAREVAEAIGVEPDRIPLRACAAAAHVYRANIFEADKIALIVNPLTDEADLTVQDGDKVVLMRTVRLPDVAHSEARQRALIGEIRRTMAAVRQQLADRKVDHVVVCGAADPEEGSSILGDELDVPVTLFAPAAYAPAGLHTHAVPPESLGRFAAVLGMAHSEADRRPPIVDFANVRRRAEARRFSRVHALAAGAAAAAVLWVGVYLWRQLAEPTRELAEINARIQELQAQADMYKDVTAQAAAIDRWQATNVNWLDELEQLARRVRPQPLSAEKYPVNDDVVVTQLTVLRAPPGDGAGGGRIDLQTKLKSDSAVRNLEQRLADERRRVSPGGITQDNTLPGYPRATDLQIHVLPPDDDAATAHAEATP
jgi:hypothetical protein